VSAPVARARPVGSHAPWPSRSSAHVTRANALLQQTGSSREYAPPGGGVGIRVDVTAMWRADIGMKVLGAARPAPSGVSSRFNEPAFRSPALFRIDRVTTGGGGASEPFLGPLRWPSGSFGASGYNRIELESGHLPGALQRRAWRRHLFSRSLTLSARTSRVNFQTLAAFPFYIPDISRSNGTVRPHPPTGSAASAQLAPRPLDRPRADLTRQRR